MDEATVVLERVLPRKGDTVHANSAVDKDDTLAVKLSKCVVNLL